MYSVYKGTQGKVQISVLLKMLERGLGLGAPWGCLSTGFRVLKGTASLFLPCYFCILNVSSQDKCPSPCFTARMDFPSCGFSASNAVTSLMQHEAAGQSRGRFRVQVEADSRLLLVF